MSRSRKAAAALVVDAQRVLDALGLPAEQTNERAALTLLALVDLKPGMRWAQAGDPLRGVTPIMEHVGRHFGKVWAANTRETVRRFTLHQFVHAGLVVPNPGKPTRPTNSPHFRYQIAPRALALLHLWGTPGWEAQLASYLADVGSLRESNAQRRAMDMIPLQLPTGDVAALTPGGQNPLVRDVLTKFCPHFVPGAYPVYVGDAGSKWLHFDRPHLAALGVAVQPHGKMPDVVVHDTRRDWLVLIEAVSSHGPIDPQRLRDLKELFRASTAGLVFVTTFPDRATFRDYAGQIAWETEVWTADFPDHMIHFDGERFLGPYHAPGESHA